MLTKESKISLFKSLMLNCSNPTVKILISRNFCFYSHLDLTLIVFENLNLGVVYKYMVFLLPYFDLRCYVSFFRNTLQSNVIIQTFTAIIAKHTASSFWQTTFLLLATRPMPKHVPSVRNIKVD